MSGLEKNFKSEINGKEIDIYFIKNKTISVAITNYGARVVRFLIPDKNGILVDIVVGFKSIEDYFKADCPFYGAIIGRFANRIANGKFTLDEKTYQLERNNGPNALHGGSNGFHNCVWDVLQLKENSLELSCLSVDGEDGYPGTMTTKVLYSITDDNEFRIDYEISTDKKTIANITNHNFWNLNGEGSGDILNHELKLNAKKFIAIDANSIPAGTEAVHDTPFDFSAFHKIGKRINVDDEQIKNGNGYDHNFCLDKGITQYPELVAVAKADVSGIVMEVSTTEPGLQFYSGNFMEGKDVFKSGKRDEHRTAFCLEAQHFPDSPNQPTFPTTVIEPGKVYRSTTMHKFNFDL